MTPPLVPLPIIVAPCSWHSPQAELKALNLKYPGRVSSTICPTCAEKLMKETA